MNVLSQAKYTVNDDRSLNLSVAQIRQNALSAGCPEMKLAKFLTLASELGRNILNYAGNGHLVFKTLETQGKTGLEIAAVDEGPGIKDIPHAMKDNVSTSGTLGLGLPGAKRLADEFHIESTPGKGTTVQSRVWI